MHFERLLLDRRRGEILDARVGDEVFSGARVEWSSVGRGDMIWLLELLDEALAAWVDDPDASEVWLLEGTRDEAGAVAYALEARGGAPTLSWRSLDAATRATITARLDEVLEAINGLLLIYT